MKLEQRIYNIVKKNVLLKNIIRYFYQVVSIPFRPRNRINTNFEYTVIKGYFFGFHDKIPFSMDDSKILVHKIPKGRSKTKKNDFPISIGFLYGENFSKFKLISETTAWNYQQGSMLQWYGKDILFNYFDEDSNSYKAKIIDCDGSLKKIIDYPIGSVSNSKLMAISYSFTRLGIFMKGYGYQHNILEDTFDKFPTNIYLINIQENKIVKSIKLDRIIDNYNDSINYSNYSNFVTHFLYSPNDKYISFFHRYVKNKERLMTNLVILDSKCNYVDKASFDGMVSHYSWINDNEIFCYANTEKYGDRYYIYNILNKRIKIFNSKLEWKDGHPQVWKDSDTFITDTYADKFRYQSLFLGSISKMDVTKIAYIFSPLRYRNEYRCDLHPRWNNQGSSICVDSTFEGLRSIVLFNLADKSPNLK